MTSLFEQTIMNSGMAALAAIPSRKITAVELTMAFLDKIVEKDAVVGAVTDVMNTRALEQARAVDQKIRLGKKLGPLAGLPVLVKENCDTAGAVCSAGLEFRSDHQPSKDSWISQRLKKADAIILGVTASDPGAFDVRTLSVTHPLNTKLSVGGSSGGSAAALAAGFGLGAIGTDTGGSIRIPAACCKVVGLKPTFGALPMDGIFPLVPSLDHVGPMAKTVEDVELLWNALSTAPVENSNRPKTLGFDPAWIKETDTQIQSSFAKVIKLAENMGFKVSEIQLPDLDLVNDMHMQIFVAESAAYHLAHHGKDRDLYPQIARFGFDAIHKNTLGDYVRCCQSRVEYSRQIDRHLESVDLIIGSTLPIVDPPRLAQTLQVGAKRLDFTAAMVRHTCLFDHTGHPALAMPMENSCTGVPPSLQIVGKRHREANLLAFGKMLEGALFEQS